MRYPMRILSLLLGAAACGPGFSQPNTLTPEETGQGFKLLFNGTMQSVRDNFVGYQKDGANVTTLPANIQAATNGEYFYDNNATQDIRSKNMYDDFEIRFDYRISDNAGFYYRANVLTGAIFENSIEYPLYNGTPVQGDWNAPGAAYDIYASTVNNYKNFGTNLWNSARIRVFKDSVNHWHNDALTVKFSFLSSDYQTRKVARKWANAPCLAVEAATAAECDHGNPYRKTGYIGFQTGYPGQLYLRNLRLAKYPLLTPTGLKENLSQVRPSRLSAAPARGKGLAIRVSAGKPFRLLVHRADGSLVSRFEGPGEAQAMDLRTPTPGLYFLRFESEERVDVRTIIIP